MSRSAKLAPLSPNPKPGGMEDMRAYGEHVEDFLLEIREHLKSLPTSVSTGQLITRVEYFILHDVTPDKAN